MSSTATPYLWVRHKNEERAVEGAARLMVEHPEAGLFTVIYDDMGLSGFTHPWSIVSVA